MVVCAQLSVQYYNPNGEMKGLLEKSSAASQAASQATSQADILVTLVAQVKYLYSVIILPLTEL